MKFVSGVYRRREIINNGTRRRACLQIALFLLPVKRFFFFLWILSDNIILLRVRFFFSFVSFRNRRLRVQYTAVYCYVGIYYCRRRRRVIVNDKKRR